MTLMSMLRAMQHQTRAALFLFLALRVTLAAPVNNDSPAQQSTDVWATVIANVAPLVALVGERNAKEFMRTVSTWHQLLPLSSAPLGILAIMVSAIRLSGPVFLRRLVGRESERRSEALVEVTPLSVRPATSVYTSRAVEIESSFNSSGVAYICGHVKELQCNTAISSFKQVIREHKGSFDDDKDMEAILAIWSRAQPLSKVAKIIDFIESETKEAEVPFQYENEATAALSYRTTGISPTHRETSFTSSWQGLRDVTTFSMGVTSLISVQFLGMRYGGTSKQVFHMGVAGYLMVSLFTFLLLMMVKSEVVAEKQVLPQCFKSAVWTFSNSRHSEHRLTGRPSRSTLVTARPFEPRVPDQLLRGTVTTLLSACLVGSYVLYYVAMRSSPWWVSLSSIGVIWGGALYRALVSTTAITALPKSIGTEEHWIGMFRYDLSQSLIATIEGSYLRSLEDYDIQHKPLPQDTHPDGCKAVKEANSNATGMEIKEYSALLIVCQPTRTALGTWSGAEDVIKVGLEVAKIACQTHIVTFPSHELSSRNRWGHVVRLRLAIYIPGLVWRSRHYLDIPLPLEFRLNEVIRTLLKVLHVCMDQPGDVSHHSIDVSTAVELSHVLCGPIAVPPTRTGFDETTATLRETLLAIQGNERNAKTRKFSVEQTVLLPTIMIASTYHRYKKAFKPNDPIASLQKKHTDGLSLSGKNYMPTLRRELERLNILEDFMMISNSVVVHPIERDESSGDYGGNNGARIERQIKHEQKAEP